MSTGESKAQEPGMSSEESPAGSNEKQDVDLTRRALIHAGWIIPAVIAVQLPTPNTAFASTVHGDAHVDSTTDI